MIQANISTTKNQLSRLLEKVKAGETVLITDRNRPVALLSPVQPSANGQHWEPRLQELATQGLVQHGATAPVVPSVTDLVGRGELSAVEILLDDRSDSR